MYVVGITYDLAIIGAGPAGISTALHVLAAAPRTRVVVVEKATFPRDKICAGGVGARAFKLLERIGVEVDVPRVPIDAIALRLATGTTEIRVPGLGAVVRRLQFDHALVRIARARGVDVREDHEVSAIDVRADGALLTFANREPIDARAVVGADGVGGVSRRALGLPRGELRAQVIELDTPATAHDLPRDTIVFDFATRALPGYAWDFPTLVDGAPLVCRGVYVLHDGRPLDDTRARTATYLAERGLAIGDYKLKRFAERGLEADAAIAVPRALLVGEAAGIDIATGEGIAQAIEYGALAGPYLAAALARDDLGFVDWRATLERHHLGRQFRIRLACYRAFYGGNRGALEAAIPRIGALLRVGVQDFAGVPLSKLDLARGGAQFVAAMARHVLTSPR